MSQLPYVHDFGILKKYTDKSYKLTHMNSYRRSGFEIDDEPNYTAKGTAGNDGKLDTSLFRTKRTIIELAMCNPWNLFCTFTLDKNKYDRKDLKKFNKDLSQFIRDYRKKYTVDIRFMLIPEQHQDGCWHMHGFIYGLPLSHLREFSVTERLPVKILTRLKSGKRVFTWEAYAKKFGFADIELIENQEASIRYITKYVTKEALDASRELNTHLYYASKGLKRAEIIYQDMVCRQIDSPDYQNEYASVKYFDNVSAPMQFFCDIDEENRQVIEQLPMMKKGVLS